MLRKFVEKRPLLANFPKIFFNTQLQSQGPDLDRTRKTFKMQSFPVEFTYVHEYTNYYSQLVSYLMDGKIQNTLTVIPVITIRFEINEDNNKIYAYCTMEMPEYFSEKDDIFFFLTLDNANNTNFCQIAKFIDNEEFESQDLSEYCLELAIGLEEYAAFKKRHDINDETRFKITARPDLTTFNRANTSLEKLRSSPSHLMKPNEIRDEIQRIKRLGAVNRDRNFLKKLKKTYEKEFEKAKELDGEFYDGMEKILQFKPNKPQAEALSAAIQNKLTLIQGPPGTGKTVLSAALVKILVDTLKHKVLVSAPSNVAVDNMLEKLKKYNLKVLRFYSDSIYKHRLVNKPNDLAFFEDPTNLNTIIISRLISLAEEKDDQQLRQAIEDYKSGRRTNIVSGGELKLKSLFVCEALNEIKKADVVCCTCSTAGHPLFNYTKFDTVLVDEAAQVIEPECLTPAMHSRDKFVVVGDHKQLGPPIDFTAQTMQMKLKLTLFERLIEYEKYQPYMLTHQFRMNECLSEFSSNAFYDGQIVNCADKASVTPNNSFKWPDSKMPMYFHAVYGVELTAKNLKRSHYNVKEAEQIVEYVRVLHDCGIKTEEIGIISPYSAQRNILRKYIKNAFEADNPEIVEALDVHSVHEYQGREKNYIMISCVRSNLDKEVGFLVDPNQLNVAITRARKGLIIVGNPNVLKNSEIWSDYLNFFHSKGLLMRGTYPELTKLVFDE